MYALLGLMRVFAAELAYRGRRYEGLEDMWSVYGGVDGLGWGVGVGLVRRG